VDKEEADALREKKSVKIRHGSRRGKISRFAERKGLESRIIPGRNCNCEKKNRRQIIYLLGREEERTPAAPENKRLGNRVGNPDQPKTEPEQGRALSLGIVNARGEGDLTS